VPKQHYGIAKARYLGQSFELSGSGKAGETTINEPLYQELAFGLDLKFRALRKNFS
jgi:hypothetical protein